MAESGSTPHRVVLDQFPESMRLTYRRALGEHDLRSRHKLLLELSEGCLERLASLAFSMYRNQSWATPSTDVEDFLRGTTKMTFGKYLELARRSLANSQSPVVPLDTKFALPHVVRFVKAVQGLEEAVELEASNITRIVGRHVEQSGESTTPLRAFDAFVMYRNRSEGHVRDYNWPVAHVDYYSLMTPLLENAVLELLTCPPVQAALLDHVVGSLVRTQVAEGSFDHWFDAEVRGIPLRIMSSLMESEATLFPNSLWSGAKTSAYLLRADETGDGPGAYEFHLMGLFHDIFRRGVPEPLEVPDMASDDSRSSGTDMARTGAGAAVKRGKGSAAGTAGELVQGFLPSGAGFHVTCPISKSATVRLALTHAESWGFSGTGAHLIKLRESLELAAAMLGAGPFEVVVEHYTDLQMGKGMGSSTADIVAGARAMADALGAELSANDLARIATSIESSDGSMYPGIVAFEQRTGVLQDEFRWWPQMLIAMVVPDSSLATESVSFTGKESLAPVFEEMVATLRAAAAARDGLAFARVATRSAELNQDYVVNEWFEEVQQLAKEYEADGLVVAHTGTIAGLIFVVPGGSGDTSEVRRRASAARRALSDVVGTHGSTELVTTPPSPE